MKILEQLDDSLGCKQFYLTTNLVKTTNYHNFARSALKSSFKVNLPNNSFHSKRSLHNSNEIETGFHVLQLSTHSTFNIRSKIRFCVLLKALRISICEAACVELHAQHNNYNNTIDNNNDSNHNNNKNTSNINNYDNDMSKPELITSTLTCIWNIYIGFVFLSVLLTLSSYKQHMHTEYFRPFDDLVRIANIVFT